MTCLPLLALTTAIIPQLPISDLKPGSFKPINKIVVNGPIQLAVIKSNASKIFYNEKNLEGATKFVRIIDQTLFINYNPKAGYSSKLGINLETPRLTTLFAFQEAKVCLIGFKPFYQSFDSSVTEVESLFQAPQCNFEE